MDVDPVTPLNSGTLATMGGYRYEPSPMSQPTFMAQDPFDAYLVSLTSPAAIARAAILRQTAAAAPATSRNPGTNEGYAAYAAASLAPIPAVATGGSERAAAAMAATPVDFAQEIAAIPVPEAGEAPAQGSDTPMGNPAQTIPPANDSAPAANAASPAANEPYEADAASRLAQGSGSLATDAAAKFMGAGQQSGLEPDQTGGMAAYAEALKAIPAINGTASSAGLAANTHGPQGRTLPPIVAHLAPLVQALRSMSSSTLDMLA
jgi:hypothetical protein